MATATGDIAVNYSAIADTNPYVHDSGVFNQSGPGFLVASGALKGSSGASFFSTVAIPSADPFSIEMEVATLVNSDPISLAALDASGNGYVFKLISDTAGYLYKYTAGVADGSGITPNAGISAIGDNFVMSVNKATGTINISRNGTQVASYTGLVDYMTNDLKAGFLYERNNIGSASIASWAAVGYAPAGPSITPSDPVVDGAEATITASGLSGAITTTLGGYSITTAGTLPNLTYTTDIASITANGPVSAPRIGESLTLSVTGDEGEATSTVDFDPAAGYAAVTLAGTLANETDSLIDGMQTASGLTVAVGDIMYYPTADTTSIAATGALTTDSESFTLMLIQGGSATTAGNAYAFTVTPEAVTNVVNSARPRSFSVSNLRIGL